MKITIILVITLTVISIVWILYRKKSISHTQNITQTAILHTVNIEGKKHNGLIRINAPAEWNCYFKLKNVKTNKYDYIGLVNKSEKIDIDMYSGEYEFLYAVGSDPWHGEIELFGPKTAKLISNSNVVITDHPGIFDGYELSINSNMSVSMTKYSL